MTEQQPYIPGMCNINKSEIAYRRKAMWFGVILTIAVLIPMLLLEINPWLRLIVFIPIYIAAISYLQAKNKFCVSYGTKGMQNASEGSAGAKPVADKEAVAVDKKKARTMNIQAFIISLFILVLIMLVPNPSI